MFKKSKGAGFKSGKVSSEAAEKKETLEGLGYSFDSVTKKSGWSWHTPTAHSSHKLLTESEIIDNAWHDAGERTRAAMKIPPDTWQRMGVKEQAELIQDALSGS